MEDKHLETKVDQALENFEGNIISQTQNLFSELNSLKNFIKTAKQEISDLTPEELRQEIPNATDELDAIVLATEKATNSIMEASEGIETAVENIDASAKEEVINNVTNIYEACSFQDITGQRISKVISTLQYIEEKLFSLMSNFADETGLNDLQPKKARAEKDSLLNGPQLPDEAKTQEEIDDLFDKL